MSTLDLTPGRRRPYHRPAFTQATCGETLVTVGGYAWSAQRTRGIVEAHRQQRGALLPILHALMAEFGYIDPQAIPVLAEELNLSQAEVYGVITFYRDFRTTPPGAARIGICRAEACQAVGAENLIKHATARLGVGLGQTTAAGAVSLTEVFCLGNCALGPSIMVNDRLVGLVDNDRFDGELATLAELADDAPKVESR